MVVLQLIGRTIRRALAITLLALIRGRRVVLVVGAAILVGWLVLPGLARAYLPVSMTPAFLIPGSDRGSASTARVPSGKLGTVNAERVPSVDAYLNGLTQFDARQMWGSLADEAVNSMQSRGASVDVLQTTLDEAKRRGARYEDVTMIGNYPLQDGRRYLFYVLSRRGFGTSDQLEQVYYVFTVGTDGKISQIE